LAPFFSEGESALPDVITSNSVSSSCLSWIRKISRELGVFPSSFILDGVEKLQHIGGGGFADVYKGYYEGKIVAIKFIRHCDTVEKTRLSQRVREQQVVLDIDGSD
jgi:hypothetical protein